MPRKARFTIENGNYHILSRGNNRQIIFNKDADFQEYLKHLLFYKKKYGVKVYHYVLMSNHVHLILWSPTGKFLSELMKCVNLRYAQYYRKVYGGIGHFWQDRFKSFLIEDGKYLLVCGRYIELNPVRAGIVKVPEEYHWSSYRSYSGGKKNEIVDLDPEYFGLSKKEEMRQKLYQEFVMDGIKEKRSEERFFRDGAYGSKEFVERLKERGLRQFWSHKGRPKSARK